jgi:AmmeMemoRadiSam system protein B
VGGRFYPLQPENLKLELNRFLTTGGNKSSALGCVVPHAGYMYSGHVAGSVFSLLEIPKRVIVMCPNHTGTGSPVAIMSNGSWETPLGTVRIDSDLAEALKQNDPELQEDASAHRGEHAIEVELPFLQLGTQTFSFVPIALGTANFSKLEQLGAAIARVLTAKREAVLLIASSDMNHYENDAITRVKDQKAIEKILALDPGGLFDTVMNERISMCGFGPTVSMLTAVKEMGASNAELVKYSTSGDVSGDRDMVVGYAGIVIR